MKHIQGVVLALSHWRPVGLSPGCGLSTWVSTSPRTRTTTEPGSMSTARDCSSTWTTRGTGAPTPSSTTGASSGGRTPATGASPAWPRWRSGDTGTRTSGHLLTSPCPATTPGNRVGTWYRLTLLGSPAVHCPCPGPAEEAGQDYSHLSSCWSPHTQTCYFVSRVGMNWDRAGQVGRNTKY